MNVSVEMQGFRVTKVGNININANQRTPVQVQLQPGAVSESVQVTDTSVAVDTSSGGVGTTVTSDQFNNIPVARNVASLFSLAPGAVPGIGTDNLNEPERVVQSVDFRSQRSGKPVHHRRHQHH